MEEMLQGRGEGLSFTHAERNINISCNSLITLHFMSVTHECFTQGGKKPCRKCNGFNVSYLYLRLWMREDSQHN